MNDKLTLKKDHLPAFLRKLSKDYRLVAPIKNRHGDTIFTRIDSSNSASLDLDNQPQNSIKQFMLPQREVLFSYHAKTETGYEFNPTDQINEPTIFFGVRSCDLSAILYMDVTFLQGITDSHYLEKRTNSVFIGLNCNQPFANCFCNATKSGPFLEFGADLQFTDIGDRFLVEVGRSKGIKIVEKWGHFFSAAEEKENKQQYQAFLEARGSFTRLVHVDQAIKRLQENSVPEKVWNQLSLRCQDCGGCAYICPTCTCFTITDCPLTKNTGERIRSWDACTFSGFTRMTGGHNPVSKKTEAIRQRFMHKLCYDVKKHGRPSCVGCGRCVDICFGGTDILRFINLACEGS
ncbi:MAG: 4Fe-4S dicluster domain-containing protein [Proteobacteria bacterium]|nr:4Fe-4S dicluster domain-containing protein [Pseudomonadota bacterium]MBU1716048.1 4Fe-4S dicluster domain-containing protein [Pseudomonadota bacterium]